MPEEVKFADGLMFKKPSEKAPKWVIGNISIKVEEFMKFLQENKTESEWINIDVKESKGGKVYCALSTWKADKSKKKAEETGPEIEAEDDGIEF